VLLGGFPTIAELIARIIVILIAMDVHEFAHAYVAFRMGDTTARDQGRMSLNQLVNINWIGFIIWVMIGFGFLGSAPVNESRMRDRRWGMFYAVAAGPVSNLILAAIAAIPLRLGIILHWDWLYPTLDSHTIIPSLSMLLTTMVYFNILLFLFNLIPLYPLDGWTVMLKLVPRDLSRTLAQYQQESFYVFLAIVFIPFIIPSLNIIGMVIGPPFSFLFGALLGL